MTVIDNKKKDNPENKPANLTSARKRTALTLDVDYYQAFLDDTELPDHKKQELIEALWSIVIGFVDLGFGIHPLQQRKHSEPDQTSQALAKVIAKMGQDEKETTDKNTKRVKSPERVGE